MNIEVPRSHSMLRLQRTPDALLQRMPITASTQETRAAERPWQVAGLARWMPTAGTAILRYGTVLFLLLFGAAKWTRGEAEGIQPMMAHSPLTSWLYLLLSVQGASIAIGVVELTLAAMIVMRHVLPRVSAWGSTASIFMFLTTFSFLVTTPALDQGSQGFLMKDLILLGAAVYTAGEAFGAVRTRAGRAA